MVNKKRLGHLKVVPVDPVVKRRGGRPKLERDPQIAAIVRNVYGMGFTLEQLEKLVGIRVERLCRDYREDLDSAVTKMNVDVANNLFSVATDRDHPKSVQAAIFWLQARAGWTKTERREITGANGAPLNGTPQTVDVRQLNAEEREALRALIMKASRPVEAVTDQSGIVDADFEELDMDGAS